jgi:signal transduction histidine kinase
MTPAEHIEMAELHRLEDVMKEIQASSLRPQTLASRHRYEDPMPKSQEHLALLDSISTLGFWRWNKATKRVWVNLYGRKLLEMDAHSPLSLDTLFAAVHPDDRTALVQALDASTEHGSLIEMELRVVKEGCAVRWLAIKAHTYNENIPMNTRVVGCVIDDTARKHLELESLKQQRQITHLTRVAMTGALSGALAHELQQPLTSILSNAQAAQILAAVTPPNIQELQNILRDIVNADKQAGEIIQHLRSLLLRGEQRAKALSITDIVTKVLTLSRSTLAERAVTVDTQFAPDLPPTLGDSIALQQVLLNLILNACDAMSANPAGDRCIVIKIDHELEFNELCISVVDCGSGIEPDQRRSIFDPFFTTKESGLGLGLAVCRSIVDAHKGRLWSTSNPCRGAAFHFTLPVAKKSASDEVGAERESQSFVGH